MDAITIINPKIIWTEVHNASCICGACNTTTRMATMEAQPSSPEAYEALLEYIMKRRNNFDV